MTTLVLALTTMPTFLYSQKVGYVATQAVRDRFAEYKLAQQRIEEIATGWKRELDELNAAITTLEQELQKKRLVLSDAERRERDSLLVVKRRERDEFVRKKFNAGGEFDTVATNYLRPIEAKINAAVQDVAAVDGYDIVLDKATSPILVANPRYDITVKVMEKLNIFAEDLKQKQQEAIERDERLKQEQKKTSSGSSAVPSRRRGPTRTTTPDSPTQPQDSTQKQ